jgi:hypothetical protein
MGQRMVGRIVRLVAVCHQRLLSTGIREGGLERRQEFALGKAQEASLIGADLV